MQRIASSSAKTFASFLIERFASEARALLERDGVDGADPRQPRLERKLETARECGRLGHRSECRPQARSSETKMGSRSR